MRPSHQATKPHVGLFTHLSGPWVPDYSVNGRSSFILVTVITHHASQQSSKSGEVFTTMSHSAHIAERILQKAHSPDTASAIFTDKLLHKTLHLGATSSDPTSKDARSQRRLTRLRKESKSKKKRKVKPLSAKEKRVLGVYDIPDDARKFELYEPLHNMWLSYMWEILGMDAGKGAFVTPQNKGSILASADYHGAMISVARSRCVSHVGLSGIVVRDTKFTLQMVTKQNELKSKSERNGPSQ